MKRVALSSPGQVRNEDKRDEMKEKLSCSGMEVARVRGLVPSHNPQMKQRKATQPFNSFSLFDGAQRANKREEELMGLPRSGAAWFAV